MKSSYAVAVIVVRLRAGDSGLNASFRSRDFEKGLSRILHFVAKECASM